MAKITSCTAIGPNQTYDIEVDHPDHQYYLANGSLTSNSHSYAYSYNSFHCAWLYTYYEEEWIKACLDTDPDPENMKNVVKSLGYKIKNVDINLSDGREWVVSNKECVPPLSSIKSIGEKAIEEVEKIKPINSVYDFWDENNKWRFSKFNIRALSNLIKLGGFESLNCVGEDKPFKNYRHMNEVFSAETMKELKKKKGKEKLDEIILKTCHVEDWTSQEKFATHLELTGEINIDIIITDDMRRGIEKWEAKAINDFSKKGLYWFYCIKTEVRKSKRGTFFEVVSALGSNNKEYKIYLWNFDKNDDKKLEPRQIYLGARLEQSSFGFQTNKENIIRISENARNCESNDQEKNQEHDESV